MGAACGRVRDMPIRAGYELMKPRNPHLLYAVLFMLSGCATQSAPPSASLPDARSADAQAPESQGADPAGGLRLPFLERTRENVRAGTEWVARGVDGWFGDKPFEEGGHVSQGRLGLRTLWRQDDGFDFNVRFRVRMQLPNARDKAYLIIGRDNERELVNDRPEAFSRQQQLLADRRREDETFFAGVGFALRDSIDLRVGVRGGYKVYTQARYRKRWSLGPADALEFRETLFWTVSDGFGATTAFDYDHIVGPSLTFRWLNAATISESTDGLAWSSSAGLYKAFGDLHLLSAEALINGETASGLGVTEYGLRLKWSQPVYKDWLIGELILGHFWPRKNVETERGKAWALGAGVEMRF